MAQLSTSISDLILAICSFCAANEVRTLPSLSFYGFCVIGLAAALGSYRFAWEEPSKLKANSSLLHNCGEICRPTHHYFY